MRGYVALWIVVGALAGCHSTPEQNAQDFCEVLCQCGQQIANTGVPADKAVCVPECIQQADAAHVMIPDACVQCLFENESRCQTLLDTCKAPCQIQQPPVGGGGDGADAGT